MEQNKNCCLFDFLDVEARQPTSREERGVERNKFLKMVFHSRQLPPEELNKKRWFARRMTMMFVDGLLSAKRRQVIAIVHPLWTW